MRFWRDRGNLASWDSGLWWGGGGGGGETGNPLGRGIFFHHGVLGSPGKQLHGRFDKVAMDILILVPVHSKEPRGPGLICNAALHLISLIKPQGKCGMEPKTNSQWPQKNQGLPKQLTLKPQPWKPTSPLTIPDRVRRPIRNQQPYRYGGQSSVHLDSGVT